MTEAPLTPDAATSIVLVPEHTFAELERALSALGVTRDASVAPFTPDTVPGEVELAAWRVGDSGRLTYTFNPVFKLRVLTPAQISDEERARLAAGLPVLTPHAMAQLLAEPNPQRVVLGLLAARVTRATELVGAVAALLAHPEPMVTEAARGTYDVLRQGGEAAARSDALRLLRVLCEQAVPVLSALKGPDGESALQALRPQSGDYARVFRAEIAAEVAEVYERMWRDLPGLGVLASGNLVLRVEGCPAGMLGHDNELSRHFPGGYRALAPYLAPDRVWFVWRYLEPGQSSGMRYDGLVRIDDRWVWFPKPYRVVGELMSHA